MSVLLGLLGLLPPVRDTLTPPMDPKDQGPFLAGDVTDKRPSPVYFKVHCLLVVSFISYSYHACKSLKGHFSLNLLVLKN